MVYISKILVLGKLYNASMQYSGRYRNNNRVVPRSSSNHLFYFPPPPLSFRRCCFGIWKTYPNADRPQIVSYPNFSLFCKAFNVIYTITCNLCNMQYIGQTSGPLHKRISQHRSVQVLINTHVI